MEGNSVDAVSGGGDTARPAVERSVADTAAGHAPLDANGAAIDRTDAAVTHAGAPSVLLYSMIDVHDLGGVQAVMRQILARFPNGSSLRPPSLRLTGRRWVDGILFRINELTAGCVAAALIAVRRPGIVNLHFISGPIRPLTLLKPLFGYRLVLSAHGSDVLGRDVKRRRQLAAQFRNADAVTVVSSDLQACLLFDYQVPPRKVRLIPNGVDCEFWTPATRTTAHFSIVAIGRLHRVKGFDVLLEAYAELLGEGRKVTLRIVGEGPDRERLEAQASRLGIAGHVEFTGAKNPSEVRRLLRDAVVFAMPSMSEGMPLALLEAMACGRPVVATQVGGIPEIVARGTGILVPPNDVPAFANGLRRVLDGPEAAEAMARRATLHARRFSGERAVARYLDLYSELLVAPRQPSTRGSSDLPERAGAFGRLRPWGLAGAVQAGRRLLDSALRQAVEAGLPPAITGWRHVQRTSPANHLAREGMTEQIELIHPLAQLSFALPGNFTDRGQLNADPGGWSFSFRDVPGRVSRPTRLLRLTGATVVCSGGGATGRPFRAGILSREGWALDFAEIRFCTSHRSLLRRRRVRTLAHGTWVLERRFDSPSRLLTMLVPKLVLLRDREEIGRVLLPRVRTPLLEACLRMLDIQPDACPAFDSDGPLAVDELTVVEADRFRPELLQAARRALVPTDGVTPYRRVLLSKRRDRPGRRLLADEAVWRALEARGFERVFIDALDLPTQVRLMAETSVLIGTQGGWLTCMMFCPPATQVLEISDVGYPNPNFYALAAALDLDYWLVEADGVGGGAVTQRDLRIAPGTLLGVVDRILEAEPRDSMLEADVRAIATQAVPQLESGA